jgi:hypothetical protein
MLMAKNAYKMAKNGKWDLEIKVLEDFFSRQREFPSVRIGAVQIADGRKFVEVGMMRVKKHNGNIHFRATLDELLAYKDILEQNSEPFVNF